MSFQLEGSAAYNLTVDQDVNTIGANPKRARVQIVDILTASYSEVRACVCCHAVNGLVNRALRSPSGAGNDDSSRRQVASGTAIASEAELHRHDTAPDRPYT